MSIDLLPVIELGDHVVIGNGKVHWVVVFIGPSSGDPDALIYWQLRSGLTNRFKELVAPRSYLHLFQKGTP